jgi:hypothetical protein
MESKRLNPLEHPIIFTKPKWLSPQSTWMGHIPFASFLVDAVKPKIIVELGTHYGISYCAFCQAVQELGLSTQCHAIDTWQGDPNVGTYGPEVLQQLKTHHDPLYANFSCLHQDTFDNARSQFADGTIDLLHIDGFHAYETVKHDFESWLPKISNRGLVLLHDTNETKPGFGVKRFWDEIRPLYPHFEFLHAHGLGVLGIGSDYQAEMKCLFEASEEDIEAIRAFFSLLGAQFTLEVERAEWEGHYWRVVNSRSWRVVAKAHSARRWLLRLSRD